MYVYLIGWDNSNYCLSRRDQSRPDQLQVRAKQGTRSLTIPDGADGADELTYTRKINSRD